MILFSANNKSYYDFNWEMYKKHYPFLQQKGFITKEHLWWHYINVGEKEGYIFFPLNYQENKTQKNFDWEMYNTRYPFLQQQGFVTKEHLWWHYLNVGEKDGFLYFNINERHITQSMVVPKPYSILKLEKENEEAVEKKMKELKEKEIKKEDIEPETKTVYYYVDYVAHSNNRTGIQVVTIYLAKEFIQNKQKYNFNVIFVKWDNETNALVPCNNTEIKHIFNFNETDNVISDIEYINYCPIHLNYNRSLKNCVFFCPELTFVLYDDLPIKLKNYLDVIQLKSIYILYDIIPLVLEEYTSLHDNFISYMTNNILESDKIITISDFTKSELIRYCQDKNIKINISDVKSISLPYQYRNTTKIRNKKQKDKGKDKDKDKDKDKEDEKIIILLPGTVEPRKQQLLLIKLFFKFISLNPYIDVELIIFGHILPRYEKDIEQYVSRSNGKIKYLGIITNDQLFELYKNCSFSCFISKYEGYGFPISESLWHSTPVLTSNFGSMAEVAKCGGCYCVDTYDENEVYNALNSLIKSPSLITKLKKEIDSKMFTLWSDYAKNMYTELMELFN